MYQAVRVLSLAARTKNFSGAELEGVVKSAVSFALNRQISMDDLTKPLDEESIKVTMDDFLHALQEIIPAFGASTDDLERCRYDQVRIVFSLKLTHSPYNKGKNMLVIGTTSEVGFLESLGICDAFSVTYHVPKLNREDAKKISIKKLYMLVEMAAQGPYGKSADAIRSGKEKIDLNHFFDILRDIS
ncbi:hypothetical protein GW17_00015209 [Ensete ventricosum]|nr:hypothetical protein GW17_00015209 [Ensete ventricosum]